ncbi:DoxX family membrane protein [Deinococcus navajonensis]|uniref:DoxX family membrane protein n=1 Tax=Deinococcus navajonensis TaxID=309884 RepID=A0ABV8XS32_9DEIO
MARHGIALLRLSLGIVFFWFGVQKFFPGLSSAEDLATRTISVLTFGRLPAGVSLPVLATWECAIGLGLLTGRLLRLTLLLLVVQMAGTFLPLVLFPPRPSGPFPGCRTSKASTSSRIWFWSPQGWSSAPPRAAGS